jgi:hypothetical protein
VDLNQRQWGEEGAGRDSASSTCKRDQAPSKQGIWRADHARVTEYNDRLRAMLQTHLLRPLAMAVAAYWPTLASIWASPRDAVLCTQLAALRCGFSAQLVFKPQPRARDEGWICCSSLKGASRCPSKLLYLSAINSSELDGEWRIRGMRLEALHCDAHAGHKRVSRPLEVSNMVSLPMS